MPYVEYLQTPEWRARRSRSLRLVGYRCERCDVKRDLQVHHLTYVRIGEELDEDLEVLCRGCHLGHHVVQAHEQVRLYTKIVSELMAAQSFESFSDLVDATKRECVRLKITYNAGHIAAAISMIQPRFQVRVSPKTAELLETAADGEPIGKAEAAGLLSRIQKILGARPAIHHMPNALLVTQQQFNSAKAAFQVAQLISESMAKCDALEAAIDETREP